MPWRSGDEQMARATGIGGIFYKVRDPAATRAWYAEHLGIAADEYGMAFAPEASPAAVTVWSPFADTTDYFGSGRQEFMINFRVDDLDALLSDLATKGVARVGDPQHESYGKFAWIMDCDGRKIELWEPGTPF